MSLDDIEAIVVPASHEPNGLIRAVWRRFVMTPVTSGGRVQPFQAVCPCPANLPTSVRAQPGPDARR